MGISLLLKTHLVLLPFWLLWPHITERERCPRVVLPFLDEKTQLSQTIIRNHNALNAFFKSTTPDRRVRFSALSFQSRRPPSFYLLVPSFPLLNSAVTNAVVLIHCRPPPSSGYTYLLKQKRVNPITYTFE